MMSSGHYAVESKLYHSSNHGVNVHFINSDFTPLASAAVPCGVAVDLFWVIYFALTEVLM